VAYDPAMRSTYKGTPATLGNVAEYGDGLTVHCQRRTCLHSAPLDVAALIAKLGPETTVPDLRERMRCTKCGGREVEFTRTIGPNQRPAPGR
jgi:hypothetical protein